MARRSAPKPPKGSILVLSTIFLGSFLLFCIQPMVGKMLLPHFGGSASVWTVCLVTYQSLLLAGYLYAHYLGRARGPLQARVHIVLLLLCCGWLLARLLAKGAPLAIPGAPFASVPELSVSLSICAVIGIPYVLLAANSTLVQAWAAPSLADRSIYRLYSVSNAGSFAGLLAYPFLLEWFLPTSTQTLVWSGGFCIYAALLITLTLRLPRRPVARINPRATKARIDSPQSPMPWLCLSLGGTFLLAAVTNYLTLDLSPIPTLWVLLLALYLISFVIGFSRFGASALQPSAWGAMAAGAAAIAAYCFGRRELALNLAAAAPLLFLGCLMLHAWLYASRPPAEHLSFFYFCVALGGVLGGMAGCLLAPLLLPSVWEYPAATVAVAAAAAAYLWRHSTVPRKLLRPLAVVMPLAIACVATRAIITDKSSALRMVRNFYGALRVEDKPIHTRLGRHGTVRILYHGTTAHGNQCTIDFLKKSGTSYYGPNSGVTLALDQHPARRAGRPLRVGVLGLGVGALAAHGRPGDLFHFYEINPAVTQIASDTNLFTYLVESQAKIEIHPGDARLTLEREIRDGRPPFDILILDAYSGDAPPIHLLTREAFDLYLKRLAPQGIIAAHVSNWHLNLLPLCKALAREFHLNHLGLTTIADPSQLVLSSDWVLLSRTEIGLRIRPNTALLVEWSKVSRSPLWTDDFGNALRLLRFLHQARPRPTSPKDLPGP